VELERLELHLAVDRDRHPDTGNQGGKGTEKADETGGSER
jgi:hypothetical protein